MSVDYLRVSVTNRCNLRCVYCHPLSDYGLVECEEILTFDEIHRIIRLFAECGIKKVRLTGGEPLVRKNIVQFVRRLAAIDGIEELSATTNGVFLESLAAELKDAGLQRVNVSVDSIERESYERITGFDLLPRIAKGIYKAIEVGLTPVKINSVIIKGLNDSVEQITALAQLSVHLPVTVRFIEYCPTCKYTKPAGDYLPNEEVHAIIEREYGALSRVIMGCGNGPALYFKIRDSAGTIGFISGRSSIFCRSCNRLRLTSDGILMPCLYSSHTYDLKKLIRNQASDRQIRDLLNRIISEKGSYTRLNSYKKDFSMCGVGG
jgi:cyclic pyranopterin phosphate synthase